MTERQQILGCCLIDPSVIEELKIDSKFFTTNKDQDVYKLIKKGIINQAEIYQQLKHKYEDIATHVGKLTDGIPPRLAAETARRLFINIEKKRIFSPILAQAENIKKTGILDEDAVDKFITDWECLKKSDVKVIKASEIEPEPIYWLWENRIARNKFNLITGAPGRGKSLICAFIASKITNGQDFPDAKNETKGSVLYISCEDDPEDVIVPRFVAAGCDTNKLTLITETMDLSRNMRQLERLVKRMKDPAAVIIDPVNKYSGSTQLDKMEQLNPLLTNLMRFAKASQITTIGIHHNRKDRTGEPMDMILGSRAWSASPRVIYAVEFSEDKSTRLLLPIKNNLAPPMSALEFIVNTQKTVISGEEYEIPYCADFRLSDVNAEDVMTDDPERQDRAYALAEAKDFIKEILKDGGLDAQTIFKEAASLKINIRTLKRAKKELDIDSVKDGKHWYWIPKSQEVDTLVTLEGGNS
jgi:putative DNA primase/helicase